MTMLHRPSIIFALLLANSLPGSGQILWYYVSPYLSTRAVAVVRANGTGSAAGTVHFSQTTLYGPVNVQGSVAGLVPGVAHRVLVHRYGDLTNGCLSIGPVFNPEQATGGQWTRPVGDLGAVQVDMNGLAHISLSDSVITLHGRNNVVGRAVAIHEAATPLSTTANPGPPLACGVVGLAAEIP